MNALLLLLLLTAADPTITSDSRLQLVVPDRFKPMSAADIEKLSPGPKFTSALAVRDGWQDQTLAIFTIDSAASEAKSLDDFVRRQQQARADRGARDPDPRRTMLPAGFPAFQFVAPKREGEHSLDYVITYIELPKAYAVMIFSCPAATGGAGQRDLAEILGTLAPPSARKPATLKPGSALWTTKDKVVGIVLDGSWQLTKEQPGDGNALMMSNDKAQVKMSLDGVARTATEPNLLEAAKQYRQLYIKMIPGTQSTELKELQLGGRKILGFQMVGRAQGQSAKWIFAFMETPKSIAVVIVFGQESAVNGARELFEKVISAVQDVEADQPSTAPSSTSESAR